MKHNQTVQFLQKVFNFCQRNGILNATLRRNTIVEFKCGPLGYLLKRNIYREWIDSCLNNPDINALPLHINDLPSEYISKQNNDVLLQEVSRECKHIFPALNMKLPHAFVVRSEHLLDIKSNSDEPMDSEFIWCPKRSTTLSMIFLCEPQKATYWYHYWQRQRYVWWRKFSTNPSQFFMSDTIQSVMDGSEMSLQFKHPSLNASLESIRKIDSARVGEIFELSSLLICRVDLDFAVLVYLCNAFGETTVQGKHKTALKLHHKLAPYKVTTIIDGCNGVSAKGLKDLSNQLFKEFKKSGISVLPHSHQDFRPTEERLDRFDEMGIPYVVILCQKSLDTGIAGLRNRDTTLLEQVHVTELISRLLMYLQMSVSGNELLS